MWCGHVYIYAQLYYSWAYILYNAMQRPRAKLMAKVPIGWAEGHQPSVPNNSKRFGRNIEECQKPPATRQANGAQGAMGLWLLSSFWGNVVFDGVFFKLIYCSSHRKLMPSKNLHKGIAADTMALPRTAMKLTDFLSQLLFSRVWTASLDSTCFNFLTGPHAVARDFWSTQLLVNVLAGMKSTHFFQAFLPRELEDHAYLRTRHLVPAGLKSHNVWLNCIKYMCMYVCMYVYIYIYVYV